MTYETMMNLSQLMPAENVNVQYWGMCLYKKITRIIVGFFDCIFLCTQLFFVELTSTSEKVKITLLARFFSPI